MEQHSEAIVKSDEVIGKNVKSKEGKDLGKIEEIVLDKLSGETRYVVLSFGGIMGFGSKLFALPWKSISYNKEQESFILNVDEKKLDNARGFDKDHWPDMSEVKWQQSINTYYGEQSQNQAQNNRLM